MSLYPYQRDLSARWESSRERRSLLVLPTGAGKTHVAASVIRKAVRAGKRVLFLAHRRELIEQAYLRITGAGVAAKRIGVILGNDRARRNDAAPVQVASVEKFRRLDGLGKFDIIFVDEAHRAPSPTYREVLERFPKARIVGLTATPQRFDGKALGDMFDELLEGPPPLALVEQGHLALPRVFTVPEDELPRMLGVRVTGGDFATGDTEDRVSRPEIAGSVIRDWLHRAEGRPTVVFCVSVAHAHKIAYRFRRQGVATEIVTGKTKVDDRAAMLARVADGTTKVIVNCEILTEGWDAPNVRCVVLARPTLSDTLYMQQVGRVMRPGPIVPLILDHAGNVRRHGLPESHFDWELTGSRPRGATGFRARTCPACGAMMLLGARECPACGSEMPAPNTREEPLENGLPLAELARHYGVQAKTLYDRISRGWSLTRALHDPRQRLPKLMGVRAASTAAGLSHKMVRERMVRHGISLEEAIALGPAFSEQIRSVSAARYKKAMSSKDTAANRARAAGLSPKTVSARMVRFGVDSTTAIQMGPLVSRVECGKKTAALQRSKHVGSINSIARAAGFKSSTIHERMKRHCCGVEDAIAMGPPQIVARRKT